MSNNQGVHNVLSTVALDIAENGLSVVVFGTVAFSVLMSVLLALTRGTNNLYDQIGQGGLSRESEHHAVALVAQPDSPAARTEQEQEIRQMLRARSERMVRKGQPALDIDAELAKLLLAPAAGHDAGLEGEVRQLVIAKNERRTRQGLEPLDVAAEIERTLAELDP
jgi:hypothetical protein